MNAPQFTPGPWNVEDGAEQIRVAGRRLASVWLADENWPANARLIAAAPELYEALRNLLPSAFDGPAYDAAVAALAKARGEQ